MLIHCLCYTLNNDPQTKSRFAVWPQQVILPPKAPIVASSGIARGRVRAVSTANYARINLRLIMDAASTVLCSGGENQQSQSTQYHMAKIASSHLQAKQRRIQTYIRNLTHLIVHWHLLSYFDFQSPHIAAQQTRVPHLISFLTTSSGQAPTTDLCPGGGVISG